MALVKVRGLVVRSVNYGEKDRILSLLTEEKGLITVMARGSRSLKSRSLVATETFCYSSYVLDQKGTRYTVREVELIESFFGLRSDLCRMALASYVGEVAAHVGTENLPDLLFLRLTLNTLYALAKGTYPTWQVKGAFEMRASAILGFEPTLSRCAVCGEIGEDAYLYVMDGIVLCDTCHREKQEAFIPTEEERTGATALCFLPPAARAALYYVIECPLEKLLSFRLDEEEDRRAFSQAAETYFLNHLETGFKTLDYYKQLENDPDKDQENRGSPKAD